MTNGEGTCFIISPIGTDGSETREHADNLLTSVIEPALEPFDLSIERADDIQEQGDITSQVVERVVTSELVIADLTNNNANVFYELAIRHAVEKPYIQVISRSADIPFDLQNTRTLQYDLNDVPFTDEAINEIQSHIERQLEDEESRDSPVSIGMSLIQMRSGDESDFEMADALEKLSELQSDINQIQKEMPDNSDGNKDSDNKEFIEELYQNYKTVKGKYHYLSDDVRELNMELDNESPSVEKITDITQHINTTMREIDIAIEDLGIKFEKESF